MSNPATTHFTESFDAIGTELPGASLGWLDGARREALAQFETLGFPTQRDEDWKYTNVRAIERGAFNLGADTEHNLSSLADLSLPTLAGPRLVFINGTFSEALSNAPDTVGVSALSASSQLTSAPDTMHDWADLNAKSTNGFVALNRAFATDGTMLRIASGTTVSEPIHLVHVSVSGAEGAAAPATHYRSVIVAEAGAQVEVVESFVSIGDKPGLINSATRIVVESDAKVSHSMIQNLGLSAYHVGRYDVHVSQGGNFISDSTSLGARLARYDIDVVFAGAESVCTLNGLYVARGRQHVDYHTRVDHVAPNCTSDEYYKGILDGHGRGVFNGRVYVHQDAQKSDASQANHNLLLSDNAEIDTKPQLEIYADDVTASHGATVGQLDDDMLYYLRTRGLDEANARGLLTFGFAQEAIGRMRHAGIREHITRELNTALPALASIMTD
ncbi:MAG: Fe-S cluster assembly protein SufD [Gammaproteobacteria bacterium]|nr:Fe-S cluster assembly protein SufD [Gammaproteobacteria bacterium]